MVPVGKFEILELAMKPRDSTLNPVHLNISICILQTVLLKFSMILTRRICLAIKLEIIFSWGLMF